MGTDAYAIITAGEKPGDVVEIISSDKKGEQIEVVYAIYKPAPVLGTIATVTHPYNVKLLQGEAGTKVTFRKTTPPER